MAKETKRSAEMRRMVEEYRASGLSRQEFCERRSIPLTTWDYWRRKQTKRPRMVKVEVAASEPEGQFTVSLANGRRIESGWRFSDSELARLIRIAESA